MGFSTYDYQQMLARRNRTNNGARLNGCDDESELHRQILDECARRGWLVFHSRMDRPATITSGAPDFVILCDGGRSLYVEAKAKKRKLSTEQLGVQAWARKLGHEIKVVRSIAEFDDAVRIT